MEFYQLNTFVKVADEGNLTRAAERLFTSQPAISAQIKALEEELGVELFERSSRGMRLTAKGQLLYDQAAATLAAAEQLAALGATLTLVARNEAKAADAARAITEGAAVFGVVVFAMTGAPLALIGVLMHVLLGGAVWPTEEKLAGFVGDAGRGGC